MAPVRLYWSTALSNPFYPMGRINGAWKLGLRRNANVEGAWDEMTKQRAKWCATSKRRRCLAAESTRRGFYFFGDGVKIMEGSKGFSTRRRDAFRRKHPVGKPPETPNLKFRSDRGHLCSCKYGLFTLVYWTGTLSKLSLVKSCPAASLDWWGRSRVGSLDDGQYWGRQYVLRLNVEEDEVRFCPMSSKRHSIGRRLHEQQLQGPRGASLRESAQRGVPCLSLTKLLRC